MIYKDYDREWYNYVFVILSIKYVIRNVYLIFLVNFFFFGMFLKMYNIKMLYNIIYNIL